MPVKEQGFSLLEVLIAMAISIVAGGGTLSACVTA
jgi:prepilin-type N-terminal cleavage/methylation domain-containing protein